MATLCILVYVLQVLIMIGITCYVDTVNHKHTVNARLNNYHRQKQLKHYEWLQCMVLRQMAYSEAKYETKAIAYLLQKGQSITLDSWQCILPDQTTRLNVHWKFMALDGTALTFIEDDGSRYSVHGDSRSLKIIHVEPQDTGFYFANVDYDYDSAVYLVEVSEADKDIPRRPEHENVPPERILESRNVKVAYRVSEWTECSRCGHIGTRFRFGVCYVQLFKPGPTKPIHYPFMDQFLGGLPCRSAFLPKDFQELAEVKDARSYYVKSSCQVPCTTEGDLVSNIIQDNGTKRFFAGAAELLRQSFNKRTVIQATNRDAVLVCPGNRHGKSITWLQNEKTIITEMVYLETRGKITMDSGGRLRIHRLNLEDSGSYSCWAKDQMIGTVNLIVKHRFDYDVRKARLIQIVSYVTVLMVLSILACRMWLNRRNRPGLML